MEYLKDFDVTINKTFSPVIKPTFIRAIVHLLLVLYAARIAPRLPRPVYDLFENQYFKLFIFSLILWTAQFSPSTSILISLAFIMSVNYSNQQPIWEFMENVDNKDAMDAVQKLAEAAASPEAKPADTIVPLANTAVSAVKTEEGVAAVKALAEQAMTQEAGDTQRILSAVETVVVSTQAPVAAPEPVDNKDAMDAVQKLAEAAASPEAKPADTIVPLANTAVSAVKTEEGVAAVKALAEQAMTQEAGDTQRILSAVETVVVSTQAPVAAPEPVPAPAPAPAPAPEPVQPKEPVSQPAPCYPIRRQDMSKVGSYENESYQDWKA